MCGIIGFTGDLPARDVLIGGLKQLEYRGYDSAGIAVQDPDHGMIIRKRVGRVSNLEEAAQDISPAAHCGIGHTRWATHGGVTEENAHPHRVGAVTLIHNGIIENYQDLTREYALQDVLKSETDTEVVAALLDQFYEGDPEKAIRKTVSLLKGSFALCILFDDKPGKIYAVRNVSPMVAAHFEKGSIIASDLTALIRYTKTYFVVPEYHILTLSREGILVHDMKGREVKPEMLTVNWDISAARKGGYPFFMLKEIYEQPEAIERTIRPRIHDGLPDFTEDGISDSVLKDLERITVVACGTAMHAGIVAKALIESELRIPVQTEIASEFRYKDPIIDKRTLVIVVSQSGETIDTLEALRLAKEKGCTVLSIVNVKGSTIARESDYCLYTHAGPEIAVASTKAYSVQIAAFYLLACRIGLLKGVLTEDEARQFMKKLEHVEEDIRKTLEQADSIKEIANQIRNCPDVFYIGRGVDYTMSLEAALKLKEISYIHAEAYAAGELKHGTIALISEGVPVIAIATEESVYKKLISNVREVKSRGAYVILITTENHTEGPDICDRLIRVPAADSTFGVFAVSAVVQLIAYYTSEAKGLDVDKPRNLAKSVTVE